MLPDPSRAGSAGRSPSTRRASGAPVCPTARRPRPDALAALRDGLSSGSAARRSRPLRASSVRCRGSGRALHRPAAGQHATGRSVRVLSYCLPAGSRPGVHLLVTSRGCPVAQHPTADPRHQRRVLVVDLGPADRPHEQRACNRRSHSTSAARAAALPGPGRHRLMLFTAQFRSPPSLFGSLAPGCHAARTVQRPGGGGTPDRRSRGPGVPGRRRAPSAAELHHVERHLASGRPAAAAAPASPPLSVHDPVTQPHSAVPLVAPAVNRATGASPLREAIRPAGPLRWRGGRRRRPRSPSCHPGLNARSAARPRSSGGLPCRPVDDLPGPGRGRPGRRPAGARRPGRRGRPPRAATGRSGAAAGSRPARPAAAFRSGAARAVGAVRWGQQSGDHFRRTAPATGRRQLAAAVQRRDLDRSPGRRPPPRRGPAAAVAAVSVRFPQPGPANLRRSPAVGHSRTGTPPARRTGSRRVGVDARASSGSQLPRQSRALATGRAQRPPASPPARM